MDRSEPLNDTEASALVEPARVAFSADRWEHAAALATRVLPTLPDGPARGDALRILARASWLLDRDLECYLACAQAQTLAGTLHDDELLIDAATLAGFALTELEFGDEALRIAQQALEVARRPANYALLAKALSSAGHVMGRGGDIDAAERLHMEAISHARENGDPDILCLALDNLLHAYSAIHRALTQRGDALLALAMPARTERYLIEVRRALETNAVRGWRRAVLECSLGELLGLFGRHADAERLLREGLVKLRAGTAALAVSRVEVLLAELLAAQGRHVEALGLLRASPPTSTRGGHRYRVLALTTALASLRETGDVQGGADAERDLDELRRRREALRAETWRYIQRAGAAAAA